MPPLRVRYQTIEFQDVDIHVRSLRDSQEYQDDDGEAEALAIWSSNWSIFGVLWDSSLALARLMNGYEIKGRRILEVGCGLGLPSLLLNKRGADISTTDYHPEVESFMQANVTLNDGEDIPFFLADWKNESSESGDSLGTFDLIIASDLLYERGHAELLAAFIDRHARPVCEIIIVDPGRGQLGRFGRLMTALGFCSTALAPSSQNQTDSEFSGHTERLLRG